MLCDNLMYLTTNHIFHAPTKHLERDCHFVRENFTNGTLVTTYIPSKDQLANCFTKALPTSTFIFQQKKLGLYCSTIPLTGSIRATHCPEKKQLEEEDEGRKATDCPGNKRLVEEDKGDKRGS